MSKDFYKVLGVNKTASESEIKDAYMKSVKKYHPDLNPNNKEAESKFKEINEAYDTLKDSQKRKQYDSFGSDYSTFNGQQRHSQQYSNYGDFGNFGFEDIFKNFGFDFDGFGSSNSGRQKTRAADLQYAINISLEEAYFGTNKKIEIPTQEVCSSCKGSGHLGQVKTCNACNGHGQVKKVMSSMFGRVVSVQICDVCNGSGKIAEKKCNVCRGQGLVKGKKTLDVKIPKGVSNGTVLRLQNEGLGDTKNKGDLYLQIQILKHPIFIQENFDLYSKVNVNLITAILGDEIEVPTIEGKAKLKIPKGTQSNTTLRMKGFGMPHLNSGSKGDQYVKINVEIPTNLTKDQESLLKDAFGKTENKDKKEKPKKTKKKKFW